MKIPYIRIQQKGEIFYLSKIPANLLKNHVSFHFRQAYSDLSEINESFEDYKNKIQRKGIEITQDPEGIQRRLQISKINSIKEYLENDEESFFPNTAILAIDFSGDNTEDRNFIEKYQDIEDNEVGVFEISDNKKFQIVDGQHRLAGLFMTNEKTRSSFEMPVVLLINITINTCAKIFADVNGKQSPVNKSVIYDLYDLINKTSTEEKNINKQLHTICKKFNIEKKSPLYQHIKMLGIGNGAISQSFFVNALRKAFTELNYNYDNLQDMYTSLFYYFSAYQRIFPGYWPVLENTFVDYTTFKEYSEKVLKTDKSQLLKTNGFGAIMYLFPFIYKKVKKQDYQLYYEEIIKLKDIDWCNDEILKGGTGEKTQKNMAEKLKNLVKG